jgi:ATP-dependent RNA helicase DDX18/HAS1
MGKKSSDSESHVNDNMKKEKAKKKSKKNKVLDDDRKVTSQPTKKSVTSQKQDDQSTANDLSINRSAETSTTATTDTMVAVSNPTDDCMENTTVATHTASENINAADSFTSTITNSVENASSHFYSDTTFAQIPLSEKMQSALGQLQFTRMTHIQAKAIPAILTGQDVIGAAPTGSGKTLAFVVPILDLLQRTSFTTKNGTGAIIITPTRELALQIYGVISDLCTTGQFTQTYGLIMGGANRRTEAEKLSKGVNFIVATPGRLLDHLQNTKGFIVRNLLCFIMDEADRILEQGFEDDLRSILKLLPKSSSSSAGGRQTILFSATQTKRVQDLVRLSMNPEKSVFVEIPVHHLAGTSQQATAVGIEQGYVTCPSDQRFLLLFTFLKKNKKKKIMVFFSSCNSVKYHSELLNYIDVPVMDIHGRQKQVKRTTTFFQFCKNETGTLLCTDVAARGLDIPRVDWIIQFDPPDDPKEYIHRVGRTARGANGMGRALLFLTPEETGFLRYLRAAKVTLSEYEFPISKVANVQSQLQRLIESNYYLNRAARDAYRSYLLSYASHAHRDIFNVHELDLQAVGTAFGFTTPPRVDISFGKDKKTSSTNIGKRKKGFLNHEGGGGGDRKKQRIAANASGHAFSADNPYGKRAAGDKRQFTH